MNMAMQLEKSDRSPAEAEAPEVQKLVDRFRAAGKKTVSQLLETATVMAEAHEELGERALVQFYSQIGLDREGSTSRKMRRVGERKSRFDLYQDILPSNWTTLYQLAKLSETQFTTLIDDRVLNPFVTLQTINDHLAGNKPSSRTKAPRLVIDISKVREGRPDFARKLKSLLKEYDVLSVATQGATLDRFIDAETQQVTDA